MSPSSTQELCLLAQLHQELLYLKYFFCHTFSFLQDHSSKKFWKTSYKLSRERNLTGGAPSSPAAGFGQRLKAWAVANSSQVPGAAADLSQGSGRTRSWWLQAWSAKEARKLSLQGRYWNELKTQWVKEAAGNTGSRKPSAQVLPPLLQTLDMWLESNQSRSDIWTLTAYVYIVIASKQSRRIQAGSNLLMWLANSGPSLSSYILPGLRRKGKEHMDLGQRLKRSRWASFTPSGLGNCQKARPPKV